MALKLKAPEAGEGDFPLTPKGTHNAACVALIDMGTQFCPAYETGPPTWKHQVYLAFELLEEEGRPVIGRAVTFSLNEKATLRGVLKAIRGKDITPGEEVDFRRALGRPCQVVVEHGVSKTSQRPFAKLLSVVGPPKGYKPPALAHTPVFWEIDSGEPFPDAEWVGEQYSFGKSLLECLEASQEWNPEGKPAEPGAQGNGASPAGKQEDDSIPW